MNQMIQTGLGSYSYLLIFIYMFFYIVLLWILRLKLVKGKSRNKFQAIGKEKTTFAIGFAVPITD